MTPCEVCEGPATKCCASIDQPMLWFCDKDYRVHVKEAHHGRPLPGSPSLTKQSEKK